ncbi:hypothetical protein ACIBEH_05970 [Nocardia salmonicida]|uniref:hypothetical protein n=1 Tax=Nocardia salmonicida TaxID=53431 RepID=UPI00379BF3CC
MNVASEQDAHGCNLRDAGRTQWSCFGGIGEGDRAGTAAVALRAGQHAALAGASAVDVDVDVGLTGSTDPTRVEQIEIGHSK